MFGLDPFSQPVAIIEIVLLLMFAAFIGWLVGRIVLSGRVNALRSSIAESEAELERCRQAKLMDNVSTPGIPEPKLAVPPVFVHADPLLPAFTNDDTPEFIDADSAVSTVSSSPVVLIPETPPVVPNVITKPDNSEAAVLNRIAARASEVNFDRIGRATATESDDLKDIVGIGPFLERKLHSLGIYTFKQIANFTKEDIDKVNELIEFFPGRIERDEWVKQAKAFYERKSGAAN
ncbi:hypothetical protein [Spirosoma fluviale]|uniref:NADH-quinone oxidoreductase subunit E n=1 Tax=Spirosoma fluviale TaxID=1597977 RepID=A0A286FF13_9BACT|nr:hypothetical protein [Spirosoma fluviale]SOD81414.1 hypothetical protein SAMN06269250_1781 [Spirosoma fluviale]